MKPIILITITLQFFSFDLSGQNCSGIFLDKKDEFTGLRLKASKTTVFKKGTYETAYIQLKKEGDSLKLTFVYSNNTSRVVNASLFTSQKGDKLYLLFEDASTLALDLAGELFTAREESANVGTEIVLGGFSGFSKSNKFIFEPEYQFNQKQLEMLTTRKVTKIRVIAKGVKADTGKEVENIEFEVTPAFAKQLMEDANCLLK